MVFANSKGSDAPVFRRHPYFTAVFVVLAAALLVTIIDQLFDFPPFLAFACAVAMCFVMQGVRPGLLALILSVVVSDLFFIEPLWTFTRYSFVFAGYYLAAAVALRFFARRFLHIPKAE